MGEYILRVNHVKPPPAPHPQAGLHPCQSIVLTDSAKNVLPQSPSELIRWVLVYALKQQQLV